MQKMSECSGQKSRTLEAGSQLKGQNILTIQGAGRAGVGARGGAGLFAAAAGL